ncbi:MAG: glycosyltransferase family 4 protein [Chthoniobacterales bacterium]|nr:glycosyltransferase family 4 protein [Chthoniobacterales bacterium]
MRPQSRVRRLSFQNDCAAQAQKHTQVRLSIKHFVAIIQEKLPHYRAAFFDELRAQLASQCVALRVLYSADSVSRNLPADLPWAVPVKMRCVAGFVWQSVLAQTRGQDLVIVPQEVKYGALYVLLVRRYLGRQQKLAFWGHGRNFQTRNPDSLAERWKRFVSGKVDWWFAYNDLSARIVENIGFPQERITNVGNAIDTRFLRSEREKMPDHELLRVKKELGLSSENIGIFAGGLYPDKRIAFLIEASARVRALVSDFELIIIGNGPDRHLVEDATRRFPWVHYAGAKNDSEKVPYWAAAKLLLMPGLVGLVVLDSFALGTPMVTTAFPYHSPEIDYLHNGLNGVIVQDWKNAEAYAYSIAELLRDDRKRESLAAKGYEAAGKFTIENMASNFTAGVLRALQTPRRK